MNIMKADIDLNSLFNFTYSFDQLKVMIEMLLNNQNTMVNKINELEQSFKESESKNEDLYKAVNEKQVMYEKKIQSVETYIKKKYSSSNKEETTNNDNNNGTEGNINTNNKDDNTNTNKEGHDNDNKLNDVVEGNEEINNNESNCKDEEKDFVPQGDSNEITSLKHRVYLLEKKTKNMNLLKFGSSLNSIQNEKNEMALLEMKDLNDKFEELRTKNIQFEKDIEDMKIKVLDFDIYDLFKNCTIEGGNLDASKLLIMNLEKKVFKKTDLIDMKISKNEEDIYKLKNDFKNMKNQSDVNNKIFNNLKEDFTKIIEEIQNYNNENLEQINSLDLKLTDRINNLLKAFDKFKQQTENDIKQLQGKPIEIQDNNNNNNIINNTNINENDKQSDNDLNQRINDIEQQLQLLSSSMQFTEIINDINQIKDNIKHKANQLDVADLKDKLTAHTIQISELKDVDEQLTEEITKHMEYINSISRTLEPLNSSVITLKETIDKLNKSKSDSIDMSKYVDYATFSEHLKSFETEKDSITKDFNELRRIMNDFTEVIKTKATDEDLKNLEEVLISKVDELRILCLKRFADKTETSKSIKYIDTQLKHIIEVYIRKQDKGDNWLIAKKPINGFKCASCEAYIGDLKDRENYLAWNKYPMREPQDKAYRIGNGFSRMLSMLNVEVKGNYDTLDINKDKDSESRNRSSSSSQDKKRAILSSDHSLPFIKPYKQVDQSANNNDNSTFGEQSVIGDGSNSDRAASRETNDPKVIKIYRKNKVNPVEIPSQNN